MTEDNKRESQEFLENCFKDMKKEEKDLFQKKEYQNTLKNTLTHITGVISNEATSEQLKEYRNIDARVQEVLTIIENIVRNITQAEIKLDEIQKILKEELDSKEDFSHTQIDALQAELTEYTNQKNNIEKEILSNKTSFVLKELNYFSDKISLDKNKYKAREVEEDSISKLEEVHIENKEPNEKIERKLNITSEQKKENTNVLIISEREGKVYLPYLQENIDYYLEKGYSSVDEVVREVFTVPLKKYSNYSMSRVTEGFKLMREREKASFGESLKYALNLVFERNLHPAIITACRTMDDLDIYLACLEDNVLSLFDAFEIRFEYRPTKIRQNGKSQYFEGV